MKRTIGVIGALGLACLPLSALAQEDGGVSDTGVHVDAAVLDSTAADTAVEDSTVADTHVADTHVVDSHVADGATADATVSCGTITYIGECQGDSVRYCLGEQLRVVDCVDRYGANATCGLLDCTDTSNADCQGYWCVPETGSPCDDQLTACDVASQEGCVNGVCATSTTCDPAAYQPICTGTVITSCGYTVNDRDCAADGRPYTCGARSSGGNGCLGAAGAACDMAQGLECQTPLSCIAGVCGTPQPDAGQPLLDAGPKADAGTGGSDDTCGCQATSAGSAALALLAMVGLVLVRRRR